MHNNAEKAAEAAECAHEQGKFWEYHDKLFANQRALALDNLKQYAKDVGLNSDRFDKCLDGGEKAAEIQADIKAGQENGVSGTPAFFINGVFLNGAQPFESFADVINKELESKGVAVPEGAKGG